MRHGSILNRLALCIKAREGIPNHLLDSGGDLRGAHDRAGRADTRMAEADARHGTSRADDAAGAELRKQDLLRLDGRRITRVERQYVPRRWVVGALGDSKQGTEVRADGTSVVLSGIDPIYLGEALTGIQLGAIAQRWLGAVAQGTRTLIGTPHLMFSGQVDKPSIKTGPDSVTISLTLETRLINHTRASNRRYTTNEQRANGYPNDTGFFYVENENDIAECWG